MRLALARVIGANRSLLGNTAALIGTALTTSGLGFAFWLIAARLYPQAELGIAATLLSATTWFGTVAVLGLGTLLMGELPRQPQRAGALISTALIVASVAGGLLGLLLGPLGPHMAADLAPLRTRPVALPLFALGVALSAGTAVLDQATVGLLRGGVQLWRNSVFVTARLALLVAAGLWAGRAGGLGIYGAHVAGLTLSLGVLSRLPLPPEGWAALRPDWALLHGLGRAALSHHLFNLALQTPALLLPILVTGMLSADLSAVFYVAWLLASFLHLVPVALGNVLYAVGAGQPPAYARRARLTFGLALASSAVGLIVLAAAGPWALGLFGAGYAGAGRRSLLILALGVIPVVVRQHYVATCRVRGRLGQATAVIAISVAGQIGLSAAGARLGGLIGLSAGWLAGMVVEAVLMAPTVAQVLLMPREGAPGQTSEGAPSDEVSCGGPA